MPIRLKIARSAAELDDVFKLRYDVFVTERHKFAEKRLASGGRVVDHFDAMPGVANVVAYDGETAVASFRVNRDSPVGLAPEKFFDFSATRLSITDSAATKHADAAIVSGSMLAIRKKWRHRRNVILALFKKTASVMNNLGATHVFGAASAETFSLYGRLGFQRAGEERWVEQVGDHLVPMAAPFDKVLAWTFGRAAPSTKHFWLDTFNEQLETILLSPGELLYKTGEPSSHFYGVLKGLIALSDHKRDAAETSPQQMARGKLFGKEALYEKKVRLTDATAMVKTELLAIERDQLFTIVQRDQAKMKLLLQQLSSSEAGATPLALAPDYSAAAGDSR